LIIEGFKTNYESTQESFKIQNERFTHLKGEAERERLNNMEETLSKLDQQDAQDEKIL
jgi:predicted RNA-binding protein